MIGRSAGRVINRYFGGHWNAFEQALEDGFDFTALPDSWLIDLSLGSFVFSGNLLGIAGSAIYSDFIVHSGYPGFRGAGILSGIAECTKEQSGKGA